MGSGLGGPARLFARQYGCSVIGLDLTPEYVSVAARLTELVGLQDRAEFRVGSALELPFAGSSFDRATLLHVGMNIPDKERLCREVYRVLKPGGLLGVYDVMRTGEEEIEFPVPWAATKATSFVETPQRYREALESAGFEVISERDRRETGAEFFRQMKARIAASGPPPLGLHVLMGQDAPIRRTPRTAKFGADLPRMIALTFGPFAPAFTYLQAPSCRTNGWDQRAHSLYTNLIDICLVKRS